MAEFTTPKWRDHLFSVVIVGAGPAGMMLAFCLAKMGVNPLIIDNALASEHEWGRGDGMQFRTLEVLRNLGLYDDLEKQSLKVATMSQWAITENPTVRHVTNFAAGDMDIEEKYGLTIRQGIIEKILDKGFEELSPGNKVHRPWSFQDAWIEDRSDPNSLVNVTLRSQYGETRQIRTRYLVGCDGGKSQVRRTLRDRYGVMFEGSPHDSAWGAVDILEPRTNFPDIKRVW
ncbi:hypothetical protein D9758_011885 [Tetrapyrgos nigripes]|uniref:FAD-binding domain-containing protein n=1 Tax=Tetrapyrgos nigripes TaxID=182062 RepID=A0A8H5CRK6_9AGAR|nr:hypothetical protein D9758_011885 [Tetrapyrgos nigripes]